MNKSETIASYLLDCGAVSLRPDNYYTWVSGIKSPIYCDNRVTISFPEIRRYITKAFVDMIENNYPDVDAIIGTATAGIPQACWVSDVLDLPMAYVRSGHKAHGKGQQIEGKLNENSQVIVIEDLISSGKSSIEVCQALEEQGHHVLAVLSIFTYELSRAQTAFEKADIQVKSLSNYSDLIRIAQEKHVITEKDLNILAQWNKTI
ncbi:orotate phosphoribosyltransferase [Erysipelothrix urinaevulpis]|uniref:orotate phosphoribosyltransferase n=1 Tax=Erysipelothrix urinaevulpis TaxID=2683717 RepID=UPI00135B8538|nr:orotate phosphoribosyltransferase [Erysipelothrix urinaevulpis]